MALAPEVGNAAEDLAAQVLARQLLSLPDAVKVIAHHYTRAHLLKSPNLTYLYTYSCARLKTLNFSRTKGQEHKFWHPLPGMFQ